MKSYKHKNITIRIIKYLLIITAMFALLTLGGYVIMNKNNKVNKSQANEGDVNNVSLKINSPNLIGISFDHGPYYVESTDMEEVAGCISFINPKIKMMLKHVDWFNLTAKSAKLKTSDNHLELDNNVKANINHQYYAITSQAEVISTKSIIKSNQYTKIYKEESSIESDTGFIANYKNQTAFFSGKINANLEDSEHNITNIKSNKFNIFWHDKTGHFIGDVVLVKGETTVKANKMIALLNKKNNELEKIFLYGNVIIIGKDQTSTSEYGEYNIPSSILTLTNNVKLHRQGNTMTGEALYYNFKTKKANLVGQKNKTSKSPNKRVKTIILPNSKVFQK